MKPVHNVHGLMNLGCALNTGNIVKIDIIHGKRLMTSKLLLNIHNMDDSPWQYGKSGVI